MDMTCPCKNCKERHTACHAGCEKHKEWLSDKHKKEQWLKNQNTDLHHENTLEYKKQLSKGNKYYGVFYGSKKGWK